jgi:stage IV sporulation protein FB
MLLGEPPRSAWDLNFSLFGIPVRVHPLFWLVALVLGPIQSERADIMYAVVAWIVAAFICILVHELGHALVQRAYGYRPWITLYGLGGLASYDPGAVYQPRGSPTVREILISAAGPGAGFLLAGGMVLAVVLAGYREQLLFIGPFGVMPCVLQIGHDRFTEFLNYMFFICVLWGLVNLLPVYPLDGGQIAREVLMRISPRHGIRQSLMLSVFTGVVLAIYGLLEWGSIWVALLFGYLAYGSYATLRAYGGRGGWQ